ncbi:MAG: S8 family peptidase [candidate division Zixibacteria bacterium]|nr:S8 family peptidase [candidate division Zixibacteria bacterium]
MDFTKVLSLIRKFKFLLLGFLCFILLSTHASLSQDQTEGKIPFEYPAQIPKVDLKTQKFLEKLPPDSAVAVWVFFTDKGIKSFAQYKSALEECLFQLSERSIRRRMQRGQAPWVDFTDIPVKRQYLNEVENLGARVSVVSRWLNAASVLANKQQIEKIENLPFVRAVKKVVTFTRKKPSVEEKQFKKLGKPLEKQVIGYGESHEQLAQIHVPEFHKIGISGKGVLITLLDTGFFIDHPAFKHILDSDRLVATHDFINGDDDVDDQDNDQRWHGTAVWSVVGGYFADSLVGSAYGAQFALAKTERVSEEIRIEEDHWVAGIEWADSVGTDVVSSSLGYTEWDDGTGYTYEDMDGNTALCTQAADLAVSKGMVVVNAAGNERIYPWYYIIAPADGDSVIAVGAVDLQGKLTFFSSAGPTYDGRIKPDVLACGYRTFCASSSGSYTRMDGTSLSTPLVAGVCALLLEADSTLSPIQVREALWTTASQAEHPDTLMGYGIVNAAKASGFSYLVVSPQELYFETSFGDTQSQKMTLDISDWLGESIEWRASTTADWISIFPDTESTPTLIWVTVDPEDLKAGINRDSIVISADSAINPFQKVPVVFTLHPSAQVLTFPNPFSDSLTVIVEKPQAQNKIEVSVFTVAGELVYRFPEKDGQENYQQTWDGRNERGREVGSGIYLLKIDIDSQSQIVKVAKVK